MTLEKELAGLLNKYSAENGSNTPDFILVKYLMGVLEVWNESVGLREQWYGRTEKQSTTDRELDLMKKQLNLF